MGRVLSLMIGPFALMITVMSCLMKVMHIIIQDSHSNEWPRLRTAEELNGIYKDADGEYLETACASPVGYFVCSQPPRLYLCCPV